MTTYGITANGFVRKTQDVIVSGFVASEIATIDPGLNAGAQTPLGQLNGIVGGAVAEAWEVLEACYNGLNRDDAEGPALDNIGDLDGDLRLAPQPSSVTCNCTLTLANSPYAAGSLVCNVAGDTSRQFSNVATVTVSADGTYPELFASLLDGPVQATAGTLTAITAPVSGWSAVTNHLDAVPGSLLESDQDYRERQREELAAGGASTVDSITAALLQTPGVVAVLVQENVTDFTDPVTFLPPHSLQAIVWDGTPTGTAVGANTIAQVIWDEKPSGARTFGTSSGTAVDSAGNSQTVYFTRSAELNVWMAYTVTLASGAILATVAPILKQTIVYLSLGFQADGVTALPPGTLGQLKPGTQVTALLYRAAALSVSGVVDVPNLALDFHSTPTATANLPVPATSIASLDVSRITINGI